MVRARTADGGERGHPTDPGAPAHADGVGPGVGWVSRGHHAGGQPARVRPAPAADGPVRRGCGALLGQDGPAAVVSVDAVRIRRATDLPVVHLGPLLLR